MNKTAIDAKTNRRIGGNAPRKYLSTIESAEKMTRQDLDAILTSHDIDSLALRQEDFRAFFERPLRAVATPDRSGSGKPVNRSVDGSGSPFANLEITRLRLASAFRTSSPLVRVR